MSGERDMHEEDDVKLDVALLRHELRRRRQGTPCVHFRRMKNAMPTKCEFNDAENDGAFPQRVLSTLWVHCERQALQACSESDRRSNNQARLVVSSP
jgi:hypothetical protein